MVATNRDAWLTIQSQLQKMGGLSDARIGEPTNPPGDFCAAVIPDGGRWDETTLVAAREIHRATIRIYAEALQEPIDEREFTLDDIRARITADYAGDFKLGGNVAYALPTELTWDYGYQTIAQKQFRILDILIPYRIDDSAVFSP